MKSFFNPLKTVVEITSDSIKIAQLRIFDRKPVLERAEHFELSDTSPDSVTIENKTGKNRLEVATAFNFKKYY